MEEIIAHIVEPISWIDITFSIGSLLISVVAIIISINTYRSQTEHNKNSVRPILNIVLGDYENDLYVRVDNNGVGPAIVSSINCTCSCSDEFASSSSLVNLIPYEAKIQEGNVNIAVDMHTFADFVEDIAGRTIAPGGHITLLRIVNPTKSQLLAFRSFLSGCCINIKYTDVYNSNPWNCSRLLNFFGRHQIPCTVQIRYDTSDLAQEKNGQPSKRR